MSPTGAVCVKCVPQQVHISPPSISTMRTSPVSVSFFLRSGRPSSADASTVKMRTARSDQTSSFAYASPAAISSSVSMRSRSIVTSVSDM